MGGGRSATPASSVSGNSPRMNDQPSLAHVEQRLKDVLSHKQPVLRVCPCTADVLGRTGRGDRLVLRVVSERAGDPFVVVHPSLMGGAQAAPHGP